MTSRPEPVWYYFAAAMGLAAFVVILSFHNLVDGDLWARLAAGAAVFRTGAPMPVDPFAFTPTLPMWIDHEWGTGVVTFGILRWLGPAGLLWLKIILGVGTLIAALVAGWRAGGRWAATLLIAIAAGATLLPGFIPVVRSHAFTYLLFAIFLIVLESIRRGAIWPALVAPLVMLLWVDLHGGFIAGLGLLGVYTVFALMTGRHRQVFVLTAISCGLAVMITPYGWKFWGYMADALQHPRPLITEWGPLPFWEKDIFFGFRILCVMALVILVAGWRRQSGRHSWPALAMLVITAILTWRHRRHAPFFGIMAAAVLPVYLESIFERAFQAPDFTAVRRRIPAGLLVGMYALLAGFATLLFPHITWQPSTPDGFYPARAVAVLRRAGVAGNLAVPFRWGSMASWCLYPRIKVSMDGRYEETYPETTFQMNEDFYNKTGADWDRLVRQHKVDFVLVEKARNRLERNDLAGLGYEIVIDHPAYQLWARPVVASHLREVNAALPPTFTIQPLQAAITDGWWH